MGKVMFMRKGEKHKAPNKYPKNFADATWAEVIEACQTNAVPDEWAVGDQLNMTINGTSYAIDIIGKNHDAYSDGSGVAPITFQMHDCYGTTNYTMNSGATNSGGWTSCIVRKTNLPAILALMPSEVQAAIKEVNKFTSAGAGSSTINTTADKLFLLSEIEVFGILTNSYSGEGNQYAYYAAGNSTMKYRSDITGTATSWWLRSPISSNTQRFGYIGSAGTSLSGYAHTGYNVSFAFCF